MTATTTFMTVSSADHPGAWLVPLSATSSPVVSAISKKQALTTVNESNSNNYSNSNSYNKNNNSDTAIASAGISSNGGGGGGGGGGGFLSSLFATPSKKIRAARR